MGRFTPPALLVAVVAALCAARSIAGPMAEVPFRMVDGFIAIQGQIDHRPDTLNLLVDSGASVSVLSDRTARRLGLQLGALQLIRGVGADALAYGLSRVTAKSHSVGLGKVSLAADLKAADELCSAPIDGLIGADFFRDRIVQIDFVTSHIRVLSQAPLPVGGGTRLRLKLRNDILCAPLSVNGCSPRWARLDTGCNEPLHWVVPRRAARERPALASIGFVSQPEDLAFVSVTLGSRTFSRTETVLHGREIFPGESGLLGTGLLSRFDSVTIDWPGRSLVLESRHR